MDHVGRYIGRYFVEACIGRGAVASVYRVRHARLGGSFALKILHLSNDRMRARLMQEGRAQSTLRHPNLVAVTDLVHVEGDPGLVMEFVDGPTLAAWLEDHRPELPEALSLFRLIVRGVGHAHKSGWVHRDLKPANVLLFQTEDGWQPKVCDFGLVKVLAGDGEEGVVSGQGMALGTPAYMAPEQIRNAAGVDRRADLFSLGCILYELVCGQRAFQAKGTLDVLHKVARAEYPPPSSIVPDVPAALEILVAELLAVRADQRIQSCDELLARLDDPRLLGRFARAPKQPAPATGSPWSTVLAAVLGALIVALLAVPMVAALERMSRKAALQEPLPRVRIDPPTVEKPRLARVEQPTLLSLPPSPAGTAPAAPAVEREPVEVPWGPLEAAEEDEPALPPGPRSTWEDTDAPIPADGEWATVQVTGDATAVWLFAGRAQYPLDLPVPPGSYGILARFDGPAWVNAGKIRIKPGERVTIDCRSDTRRCRRP